MYSSSGCVYLFICMCTVMHILFLCKKSTRPYVRYKNKSNFGSATLHLFLKQIKKDII